MKSILTSKYAPFLFLAVLFALFGFAITTHANPSYFANRAATASATTSPAYLIPGLATSTVTYDSYTNSACSTNIIPTSAAPTSGQKTDQTALEVQLAGSSSAAVLNIDIEYSDDCIDWYQNNLGNVAGFNIASTSNTVNNTISLNNRQTLTYTFASSTVGGIGLTNANSATTTKIILIPTPVRAVRAVASLGIGGTRGAVWMAFIPAKQISQ